MARTVRRQPQETSVTRAKWTHLDPNDQLRLSREALDRARHVIGAQAITLAEKMESGQLQTFDGPDALRLLAMVLAQESAHPALQL